MKTGNSQEGKPVAAAKEYRNRYVWLKNSSGRLRHLT